MEASRIDNPEVASSNDGVGKSLWDSEFDCGLFGNYRSTRGIVNYGFCHSFIEIQKSVICHKIDSFYILLKIQEMVAATENNLY